MEHEHFSRIPVFGEKLRRKGLNESLWHYTMATIKKLCSNINKINICVCSAEHDALWYYNKSKFYLYQSHRNKKHRYKSKTQ